jgi:cytochrome c biogenesis protein CcmG/thiol:disulfide interchange protein DsbE
MKRWVAVVPLVALAALGALFWGFALRHDPHVSPAALVGKPVPTAPLEPLGGGAPGPATRPGQGPVLINFFASWCTPCVQEAPALMALKAQGTPIIGVAYKDAPEKAQAFLDRYGDPFARTLQDPRGAAGLEFGVSGVPETFLVGADGVIKAKHSGPLTPDDAEAMADRLERERRAAR